MRYQYRKINGTTPADLAEINKAMQAVSAHVSLPHVAPPDVVTDHGALTGLGDDDHAQYLTEGRGDARYALQANGVTNGNAHDHNGGDGAQIDHGGLSGLSDDDHTQYLNNARGDARYEALYSVATHDAAAAAHATLFAAKAELGETSTTAYRGDRGKTAYDHSQATGNPHGLTVADLGGVPGTWTPTFTGFSADPTGSICRYRKFFGACECWVRMPNTGTSNATTFTISIPFPALTVTGMIWGSTDVSAVDNNVTLSAPGSCRVSSGGTVAEFFTTAGGAAWTASGNKRVGWAHFVYETA